MAEPMKDSSRMAEESARRLAKGQAEVFRKYADLLSGYGNRGLDSRAFGEGLLKLAVDQSTRLVEDTLEIGSGYWRWLMNVGEAGRASTAEAETPAGPTRKGRKPGARETAR
jgi:hypothetical protein